MPHSLRLARLSAGASRHLGHVLLGHGRRLVFFGEADNLQGVRQLLEHIPLPCEQALTS